MGPLAGQQIGLIVSRVRPIKVLGAHAQCMCRPHLVRHWLLQCDSGHATSRRCQAAPTSSLHLGHFACTTPRISTRSTPLTQLVQYDTIFHLAQVR